MSDKPRRRRSFCGCACGGCGGLALVAAIVFSIAYAMTGNYRPNIPPPPPLPSPNGYDDYVAAGLLLKGTGGTEAMYSKKTGAAGLPVLPLEQMVVERNGAAMQRMREAFGKQCRAPAVRSAGQMFPELATFRDLARLLGADADVRSARGDDTGALSDGIDTIQMGLDVRRGGSLIHGLVGIACEAIAHASMLKVLDRVPPSDARRLASRLQRVLLARAPYVDTLRDEDAGLLASMLEIDAMPGGLIEATHSYSGDNPDDGGGTSEVPVGLKNAAGRIGWRFTRDRTFREVEDYMRATVREAEKPAWQRREVPEPKWALAAVFVPVFSQAERKYEEIDARSRLMLIMLSIRAYQGVHGGLPAALADLGLDPRLLSDPYSGKPLVYKPHGGDYLLYSVGPDFRDDGGVPLNESAGFNSPPGDLGVVSFRYDQSSGSTQSNRYYRRVPHMLPPKLPPGAPPLNP